MACMALWVGGVTKAALLGHPPHCAAPRLPAAPGYNAAAVTAFYAPYLLLPLLIVVSMALTPEPFPAQQPQRKGKQW